MTKLYEAGCLSAEVGRHPLPHPLSHHTLSSLFLSFTLSPHPLITPSHHTLSPYPLTIPSHHTLSSQGIPEAEWKECFRDYFNVFAYKNRNQELGNSLILSPSHVNLNVNPSSHRTLHASSHCLSYAISRSIPACFNVTVVMNDKAFKTALADQPPCHNAPHTLIYPINVFLLLFPYPLFLLLCFM